MKVKIFESKSKEGLEEDINLFLRYQNQDEVIDVKYSDIKNLGTTYKEGYITTDENGKCIY